MLTKLISSYKIYREAKAEQKKNPPIGRNRMEAEFLPAALEVLETPVSKASRLVSLMIALFFIIALLWSYLGKVDVVTVIQGKVVPMGYIKEIQVKEVSVIRDILVKEGEFVKEGQKLIKLDDKDLELQRQYQEEKILFLKDVDHRLQAVVHFIDTGQVLFDPDVKLPLENKQLSLQQFEVDIEEFKVKEEIIKKEFDLRFFNATQPGILAIKRQKIKEFKESFKKGILHQISETRIKIFENESSLKILMLQSKSKYLYTPVDGIVQNVKTHTVGGIALVGNVLMNIIPVEGDLEVEAMVFDQDIGSIVLDQEVKLKVNSYSFTKYGFLKGTVKYIAADSVQDERLGALFKTIITINKMNERINLSAGMTVTCEVKVAKRRLIDFFISPLLETKDKVLKER